MRPSEVRAKILSEHEHLRRELARIDSLAARALSGKRLAEEALRVELRELAVTLEEHMSGEDELLIPALVDIDAWGPIRVERMMEEHDAQRAMLVEIKSASRSMELAELARAAQSLSKALTEDMRREEGWLLHPDLLRDDVVAIGQFVG